MLRWPGAWAGGVGGFCEGGPAKLCEGLRAPAKLFAGGRSTKHEARSTPKQEGRSSAKLYEALRRGPPPLESGGNPPCPRRCLGVHAGPAAGLQTATYWQLIATYSWGSQKGLKQGLPVNAQGFKRGSNVLRARFLHPRPPHSEAPRSSTKLYEALRSPAKPLRSPCEAQRSPAKPCEALPSSTKLYEALRSSAKNHEVGLWFNSCI